MEELDQVLVLTLGQTKWLKDARLGWVIQLASGRIMVERFFECGQAAIVHVWSREGDVAERGRTKPSNVLAPLRPPIETAVGRRVHGNDRSFKGCDRLGDIGKRVDIVWSGEGTRDQALVKRVATQSFQKFRFVALPSKFDRLLAEHRSERLILERIESRICPRQ